MAEKNYFELLSAVNVGDKIEKKNGLSYLSWAWAWAELKKRYPEANYTVYENAAGWNYFTDGHTCWVKTGVTVNGIEHIEYLPVMNFKNQSIPADAVTSFDVNKAIQRSLTKAVARHGLGLYIYAGEDLPDSDDAAVATPAAKPVKKAAATTTQTAPVQRSEARQALKDFCIANNVNQADVISACGLNAKSTDADYAAALGYARNLTEAPGGLPFEV